MLVFRCTQKLLTKLRIKPIEPQGRSTTQLGDWYVRTLAVRNRRLLLFVSEATFLPVVIQAAESKTMIPRFREALDTMLFALGTDVPARMHELDEAGAVYLTKTASRRVLGVMNEFVFQATCVLDESREEDLIELSLHLSRVLCGPLQYDSPSDATRKLFGSDGPTVHIPRGN